MKHTSMIGVVALVLGSVPATHAAPAGDSSAAEQVFAASRLPKTLGEAPAIITVCSLDYLDTFGFRTLNGLLRTTPGFDQRTAGFYDTPGNRGISAASLLLLDGTPLNSHLSNLFPADYSLDLFNYKRIEIISGPGGVLWGSHSLLGLINLISLDGADIEGARARVELGSGGHHRYRIQAGSRWGELDGMFSASFTAVRGDNAEIVGATSQTTSYGSVNVPGIDGSTSNRNDFFFEALGKVRYRDLTLFGRVPLSRNYFQVSEEGGLLDYGDNGYRQSDDWLFYLMYAPRFLGGDVSLLTKAYFYRNVLTFDNRLWSSNPVYPAGYGTYIDEGNALKVGGIGEVAWTTELFGIVKNTVIVGVDTMRESVAGATISRADDNGLYAHFEPHIADKSAFVVSGYGSDEVSFADRVALSGGVRYNYSDSYSPEWLYAANVVARLVGANYLKVNIATGLRPPTMGERFGLAPHSAPLGAYQEPDDLGAPMRPSLSTAYQFELNSLMLKDVGPIEDFFLRADLAFTTVENIRALLPTPFDVGTRFYLPKVHREVLSTEARLELRFRGEHSLWASYGFTDVQIKDLEVDFYLPQVGPRHAFSLGGSARLWRILSFSIRNTIETGVTASVLRLDPGAPLGGRPVLISTDPIFYLSAGITADRFFRDLKISLWVYNVLDRHYGFFAHQNIYRGGVEDGQALVFPQPGINVMMSAQMSVL